MAVGLSMPYDPRALPAWTRRHVLTYKMGMTLDLAARYAKAEGLLPHQFKKLVQSPQVRPNWIRGTETFWYSNQTATGTEFVFVDAAAGIKRPAFDHIRMAEALNTVVETPVKADELPLFGMDFRDNTVRVAVLGKRIEISLDTYTAAVLGQAHPGETPSPDGRWAVGFRDHNLYLRDLDTDEVRQLTADGVENYDYAGMADSCAALVMQENLGFTMPPMVLWSPDCSRFVTHRLDQREVGLMHLVRSSPVGGGRPKLLSYRYAVVGDPVENLATSEFYVFDTGTGEGTKAKCDPILTPFVPTMAYDFVWWSADGTKVFFISSDRGDHTVWLNELDPATGDVKVLVEETSATHITLGTQHQNRDVRVLSTGEVVWWSQRSGWAHLYLYAPDGKVTTLTSGEWPVRHVVSVDETARRVLFTAAGRLPGSDIYLQELCSVSLDGGDITAITSDGLDHDVVSSDSGRFCVDNTSRYDVPNVATLRDGTGSVVLELERADATALYDAGWSPAERVVVKAADGVTDIYCGVYKPFDFDPTKKYPVLDEIYPGPQVSTAPLRFPLSGGVMVGAAESAIFAALGFVVVTVDGRGSALRSKAFQDEARRGGEPLFVDDHAAAITQLAETRPWMDLDRVGIMGHSAGGYASTRALLARPDVFKVAVSSCGNHDNRVNHSWWGEKFFGLPDDFDFALQSNATLAEKLEGKLFLIHGEMDDNAVPHGTMRLVDALIAANKDFDMLIVPNAYHSGVVTNGYWIRKRWDYLVQHLMGETPPAYRIADVPFNLPV